jgi:hypothetical protein
MSEVSGNHNADDVIIQKLETSKSNLARAIAQAILDQNLQDYANLNLNQLSQLIIPSIEMVLRFFRDGDVGAIKANILQRAEERVKRGFHLDSMEVAIVTIANEIEKLIDSVNTNVSTSSTQIDSIPEAAVQMLQVKYKRRLDNLRVLSQVQVIASQLNKPNTEVE